MCSGSIFNITLLLFCVSTISSSGDTKRIPKCCPRSGYELTSDLFAENRSSGAPLDCMLIREDLVNVTITHNISFYGLPFNDSDIPSRLPVCSVEKHLSLYELSETEVVELPIASSCLDLVNVTYRAVVCSKDMWSPVVNPVTVYPIRKCCPVNSIYDDELSACREINATFHEVPVSHFWTDDPKDIQLLKSLINDFNNTRNHIGQPLFYTDIPQCNSEEVLVGYRLKTHEFHLLHNRIIPKSKFGERNLNVFTAQPTDPFCIDSVAPSTIHPPAMVSDAKNITWIVRVCRPMSICNSIPCVRKCCSHNEKLAKRNNETVCEPYKKDLVMTFHDIEGDSFPNEPDIVHRTGENLSSNKV